METTSSLPRRWSPIQIPPEIYEQEKEVETIFRELVECAHGERPRGLQHQPPDTWKEERFIWILIAVFAFIDAIAFYLIFVRCSR